MLWRSCKRLLRESSVLVIFILLLGLFYAFDITCVIYAATGFPCPACGMTRALISLLKGDFYAYLQHNLMALPVALVFIGQLYGKHFHKYKKALDITTCAVLFVNLIYYLIRLF